MPWVPLGPLKGPSQTWMPAGPAAKGPPRPDVLTGSRGEQLPRLALGEHEGGPDVAGQGRDRDDPVLELEPGGARPPSGTTCSGTATSQALRWPARPRRMPAAGAPTVLEQYRPGGPSFTAPSG